MRRVPGLLIVLASLAVGVVHAAEPKVYKWTDENGTVHFSAEAPATGAEEVVLDKGPTVEAESLDSPTAAAIDEPPSPERDAKRCDQHRSNLKLFEDPAIPLSIEQDGVKRSLNASERAKEVQDARDALTQCEAAVPPVAAPATPAPVAATPAR